MKDYLKEYENCTLCPRKCGVDRTKGQVGFCNQTDKIRIARAALHYWEEPVISWGREDISTGDDCPDDCLDDCPGSGAVFFSGCNMGCIYCQNHDISAMNHGYDITIDELTEEFLRLQSEGALNINLVTAAMFVPSVILALKKARERGLTIPIVYNSSGYESVETLKMLEGYIDIYLPDLKYLSSELAGELSHAPDYPEMAKAAIAEMYRQCKREMPDDKKEHKKMIVRHLVLPGHTKESMAVIKYLYETYGDDIYISIMSQYTPVERFLADAEDTLSRYPELTRRITEREYDKVVDYALGIGVKNAYIQEREVATESFIPEFCNKK